MSITDTEWMTPKEAAEYLRCSIRTVWRMVSDGRLEKYKLGEQLVRFRSDDVRGLMSPAPADQD
jgi:excisionase family DNA binding protein